MAAAARAPELIIIMAVVAAALGLSQLSFRWFQGRSFTTTLGALERVAQRGQTRERQAVIAGRMRWLIARQLLLRMDFWQKVVRLGYVRYLEFHIWDLVGWGCNA